MPKLLELRGKYPEKAGKAKLEFVDLKECQIPTRSEGTILIPDNCETDMFFLQDGRQFLLIPGGYRDRMDRRDGNCWFGGTDENPFLVRLFMDPFHKYKECGEDAFYESLKPKIIRNFEQQLRVTVVRQGDIFAAPIPNSWDGVKLACCLYDDDEEMKPESVKSESLLGTRHRFTGIHFEGWIVGDGRPIVEGIVEAPDHLPIELKGAHLIDQTEYLFDPENAD